MLVLTLAIAVLGAFPFGVLYGFPILAALTLRQAPKTLRIAVVSVAVVLFGVTVPRDIATY